MQYVDFAFWQSSWLNGEVLEREVAYWREQLAGLPPLLELPTDRPRPAVLSFRGDRSRFPCGLPAGLARWEAQALGRRENATPVHGAPRRASRPCWRGWSGQQDLAVGSPIAGAPGWRPSRA